MSDLVHAKFRTLMLCFAGAALLSASCDDSNGSGAGGATTTLAAATTTSVTGASTTTILGGGSEECAITWRVGNAVTLGALQFETLYGGAPGEFAGSADTVDCSDLTASLASFNDDDGARKLSAGFINLAGFTGPRNVMSCNFVPDGSAEVVPADFTVNVIDAADPALTPVTADVAVSDVVCLGGQPISTTTSSSTVTTTSTTVTTSTVTTTTTTLGPGTFVELSLVDAVTVGALQFNVDYSQAAGHFEGTGSSVNCSDHTGSLSSFNDHDANRELVAGLVSLAGFTGPRRIITCSFLPSGAFDASDFAVAVVDATDTSLNPITPFPTISVSIVDNAD